MVYIRIKVKYLLLILLSTLVLIAGPLLFRGYIFYLLGRAGELTGNRAAADVYYDRAAEGAPASGAAISAAQRKLELLFDKKNFGYFNTLLITESFTMLNCSYISAESADRINEQYREIAGRASKGDALAEYTIYVAMINYFSGYGEDAVGLLERLDYIRDGRLESLRELHLAAMYMGLGEMDRGAALLKERLGDKDRYSPVRHSFYAYYCYVTGDMDGFEKEMAGEPDLIGKTQKFTETLVKPLLQINNDLMDYKYLKSAEQSKKRGNVLNGSVSIGGKPAPYITIILKDEATRTRWSSTLGLGDGVRCVAVTDREGRFRLTNIPDGVYVIAVGAEWQRVQGKALDRGSNNVLRFTGNTMIERNIAFFDTDGMVNIQDIGGGKFRFNVKMPKEADYYAIGAGELRNIEDNTIMANNRFYSGIIKTEQYILDTARERKRSMNTGASFGNDGIDPYYLFEPFYHTGDYACYVTFYDHDGNILYDSDGIYPSRHREIIHVAGDEFTKADLALLDKSYGEAISLYERDLAEGVRNLHALKVLAKLYYNGWEYDTETSGLKNKDVEKAKVYFERLVGEIPDNDEILSSLASLYIDSGELQKGLQLLMKSSDPYALLEIGRNYGYMGSFETAVEYYEQFYDKTGGGSGNLMMLYILQNKRELLPRIAENYKCRSSFYADYKPLIEKYMKTDISKYGEFFKLIAADKPDEAADLLEGREDDLALLYKGLLFLQKDIRSYKDREDQYNLYYNKVKDTDIKQLMKYFGKESVQSGFGDE
ncbi:MAG TPA: hypothetical protein VHT96_05710 [Clostridia bacterium]|nr:hypothetical protein [Clostridia bacterium]